MNKEVIEKIKKLLALSESSNEHESNTAMLQVQKLLVKHKLSMKEVEEFEKEVVNVVNDMSDICLTTGRWKGSLALVICENFGCYCYSQKKNGKTYVTFVGKDSDVVVCKIVLEYAIDCIKSRVTSFKRQFKREGRSTKGLEATYALSFIQGLKKAFEEQKKANEQEWGLVLVKDPEVEKAWSQLTLRKTKYRPTVVNDIDIVNSAYNDGKRFSVSDRIANDGSDNTRYLG